MFSVGAPRTRFSETVNSTVSFVWLASLLLGGCLSVGCDRRHDAVGRWEADDEVLHLFPDHTGTLNGRKCVWAEVDASSVKTDCERLIGKNKIRLFTLRKRSGLLIGRLDGFDEELFSKTSR